MAASSAASDGGCAVAWGTAMARSGVENPAGPALVIVLSKAMTSSMRSRRAGASTPPREWAELLALGPDVRGAGADQTGLLVLLENVRAPSRDTADGEHRREELRW